MELFLVFGVALSIVAYRQMRLTLMDTYMGQSEKLTFSIKYFYTLRATTNARVSSRNRENWMDFAPVFISDADDVNLYI